MVQVRPVILAHIVTVPLSLRFFSGQCSYMQKHGLNIHIISSPGELLDNFVARERVTPHPINMSRTITPLPDLKSLWQIWKTLRRLQPSIVHAHTPKGGLLGMIGAWLARVPIRIYHVRGLRFETTTGIKRRILRGSEWLSCRLAHKVYCVSPSIRQVVIDDGLCPAEKISVLLRGSGNGVDAVNLFNRQSYNLGKGDIRIQYGIPRDAIVIGFVGRIVRDKGLVELVQAWQQLRDSYPNLHLFLVGPFEVQDPLPADVGALMQQDERIHVVGRVVDFYDMPGFYAVMDILVLPSYREGFPVAPLEAAAMALPVVASRIPGCVDAVVNGVTGILVPVRDADALAEAIRQYIDNQNLRQKHGQAGLERVLRDFRQEDIWQELLSEYRLLLAENGIIDSSTRIL